MLWALVPVKDLTRSKQRLAGILDPAEREQLVLAMLQDVLVATRDAHVFDGVLLVTQSRKARTLARDYVTDTFIEPFDTDHSRAVTEGNRYLIERHGAVSSLAISADIPFVTAEDIRQVSANHKRVTLVPNDSGEGTNAIMASPPNAIASDFGGSSLMRHFALARAAGLQASIFHNKNIAMDIDEPRDLERAVARLAPSFTRDFLIDSGIAERLSSRIKNEPSYTVEKTLAVDQLA